MFNFAVTKSVLIRQAGGGGLQRSQDRLAGFGEGLGGHREKEGKEG